MSESTADQNKTDPGQASWLLEVCLAAIVLLGAVLRCWQADESLWLDELHTSWVVADSPDEIARRAQAGNQSPLYFYFVWGIVQICGHSPWALRLISLSAGIALVAAVAWLVRRWTHSATSGLLAALLVALNRDCIFYAQEARPYALVQLSALVHAAVFIAMLQRPTLRNRFLFVAGATWLFYLHYTAFLFLIAEATCWAVLSIRKSTAPYRLPQAACDCLFIAFLFLPAIAHLLVIADRRENWARIVQAWPLPYNLQIALMLFAVIPLAAVLVGYVARCRRGTFSLTSATGICAACWFLVPVVLAWLTTLSDTAALLMVRYLVASVVGAIVFAALCHGAFSSQWYRWQLAFVMVAGTICTNGIVQQIRYDGRVIGDRTEAWDEATIWLDQQLKISPRPVFLCANLLEDLALEQDASPQLAEYCLFPLAGVYRLENAHLEPLPTTSHVTLSSAQRILVLDERGMWLIIRAGPKRTAAIVNRLIDDLRQAGLAAHVLHRQRFGTVAVLRLGEP